MIAVAGGIVLAVLFFALLPYIIASALLLFIGAVYLGIGLAGAGFILSAFGPVELKPFFSLTVLIAGGLSAVTYWRFWLRPNGRA